MIFLYRCSSSLKISDYDSNLRLICHLIYGLREKFRVSREYQNSLCAQDLRRESCPAFQSSNNSSLSRHSCRTPHLATLGDDARLENLSFPELDPNFPKPKPKSPESQFGVSNLQLQTVWPINYVAFHHIAKSEMDQPPPPCRGKLPQ